MSAEKFTSGSNAGEHRERERRTVFAKRGIVTFGAISIFLIIFVGETSLQKLMVVHTWSAQHPLSCADQCQCQDLQLDRSFPSPSEPLKLISTPSLTEAYADKLTYLANDTSHYHLLRRPNDHKFRTVFEPNRNIIQFGLTETKDVCIRPNGRIVMVGISDEDIIEQVSEVPALKLDWFSTYNCSAWDCYGYEVMAMDEVPSHVKWVLGTTTHIRPYLGNVFHHFGDRLWPHIAGFQYPLNETTKHPMDHFLVDRISTWLSQAEENMDRDTLMYQTRILGTLAPEADFLAMDGLGEEDLVCFERLVLACATCDRLSNRLGHNITKPALLRYRNAALSYLGIEESVVPLPPRPLRVAFYGRGDVRRRRVVNARELVNHLRRYKNPPLAVTYIDELLAGGKYNQSLPQVVSLFSQVDIFITVHGANTWAAMFMPKHAAVIEIEGPCGPFSWLGTIVDAVDLKHDTSNPWGEIVVAPDVGNTSGCDGAWETPHFTVDIEKLDNAIHRLALPTFGFDDRIPRHWLYNWLRVPG